MDFPEASPHDPPVEILPDVLFVHGSISMGPGMSVNRNMVAVRHEGELTLLNPIRLTAEGEQALEKFGTVKHAVRLGHYHSRDDAYTVERFGAELWGQQREGDAVGPRPQRILEEGGPLPLPDARLFVFRDTRYPECAMLLEREGGLLVTCDSVQNWESTSRCSFLGGIVSRLMGFVRRANIGPPWRRYMTPKEGSLKPDFERLLELEFDHLVGAHGQPLIGGARQALWATVQRVYR